MQSSAITTITSYPLSSPPKSHYNYSLICRASAFPSSSSSITQFQSLRSAKTTSARTCKNTLLIPQKSTQLNIDKLRDAATAQKRGKSNTRVSSNNTNNDESWEPSFVLLEATKDDSAPNSPESPHKEEPKKKNNENMAENEIEPNPDGPFSWGTPIVMATIAGVVVRLQIGTESDGGNTGGSLLEDIVNSSWLQVILAGTTWYLIGMAVVELVDAVQMKTRQDKQ